MEKETIISKIKQLKKEKNAVILAHYYQKGEIQDIADYTGDSFLLSKIARDTEADIIVFCGVHFMAETAKILSPSKKVLLPVKEAGCPMADMVTEAKLKKYKRENPDRVIVCYVNSTARVKALSDVCVTSSNAESIIKHYKSKPIMYVPDKNLGTYLKEKYKLTLDVWPGFCCIHNNVTLEQLHKMQQKYPNAEVIVHPEVNLELVDAAKYAGSTKQLLEYVTKSSHNEFIVGTENGILHKMKELNPNKTFHLLDEGLSCYDMKLTNLEDVYNALVEEKNVIEIEEEVRKKAFIALNRMMELS